MRARLLLGGVLLGLGVAGCGVPRTSLVAPDPVVQTSSRAPSGAPTTGAPATAATPVAAPAATGSSSAPRVVTTVRTVVVTVTVTAPAVATSPAATPVPARTSASPTLGAPSTTSAPTTTTRAPTPSRVTASGTVDGCSSYGANCDGNPLYASVPPPGYDYTSFPKNGVVDSGVVLPASCWTTGGTTTNYAAADPGPYPYSSDVYYLVQAPSGARGWIPDTYFVRDRTTHLGLPACTAADTP